MKQIALAQPRGGSVVVSHAIHCAICGQDAKHFFLVPNDTYPYPVCRYHLWYLVGTLRPGDSCTALTIHVVGGHDGERDSA